MQVSLLFARRPFPIRPRHSSAWRLAWAVGCLVGTLILTASAASLAGTPQEQPSLPADRQASTHRVAMLLDSLGSKEYEARSLATEQLIELGAESLPELAERFFDGSPETAYRVRKILEGVSTEGDEATFLKSTGLLLVLFSNDNDETMRRIRLLKADWNLRRRRAAIEALKNSGVGLTEGPSVNGLVVDHRDLFNNRIVVQAAEIASSTSQSPGAKAADRPTMSVTDQKKLVQKILSASREANRKFIFSEIAKSVRDSSAPNQGPYGSQRLAGVPQTPMVLSFPDGWSGEPELLERMNDLGGPIVLQLNRIKLGDAHWRAIATVSRVGMMQLNGTALPDDVTAAFPQGVSTVALHGQKLTSGFCDGLGDLRALRYLSMTNCQLDVPAVRRLNDLTKLLNVSVGFESTAASANTLRSLSQLEKFRELRLNNVTFDPKSISALQSLDQVSLIELTDMEADRPLLEGLGDLKRLSHLRLETCKIDMRAFRNLETSKALRIEFTPQAFLGIQGPINVADPDLAGCEISRVIPDSAADKSGLQVGDVIREIDGGKVRTFRDIRLHIAQHKPGEALEMEILRDGSAKTLKVELGTYEQMPRF